MDVALAIIGLVISLPLTIPVLVLLTISNDGRPFFFQKRPGKNGHIFSIVKFRTMNDRKDMEGNLLPDSARLTPAGRFVRKTSLDELPQLINVLKGEMSFIGPRPLLVRYLPYYTEREKLRHSVKPGITGLAQVNGRNTLEWDDRFKLDIKYVENISFMIDLKIFLKTLKKIFFRNDVVLAPNSILKDLDNERANRI